MLAGLEVTTKAVERIAESIGSDIEAGQQKTMQQAVQLRLPVVGGPPIPVVYVERWRAAARRRALGSNVTYTSMPVLRGNDIPRPKPNEGRTADADA